MQARVDTYKARLEKYPKLARMYENGYLHTAHTVLDLCEDGTYFLVSGDIPGMWLRDSSTQVTHYASISRDPEIASIVEGVLRRQLKYITIDPYANAFNRDPNGNGHITDRPLQSVWVFERKYEIDSLCYPMRLLYLYWKGSGREELIREQLETVARVILDVWKTEQHHAEQSPYRFIRENPPVPWDTITNDGMGAPVAYTGMTWCGFRPSDDGCQYGYLTASEMFASVVLSYMAEMLDTVCGNRAMADECLALKKDIDDGIAKYCIVEHEKYGKIYACETDGMGNYSLIDDANIPSLLSIPYIGYAPVEDEIYQNTRRFLLSHDNPFYFEGKYARGIGSRHTPDGYIWHMALVMQGLTSTDPAEKRALLDMISSTDAGTGYLHEGFDANNPANYTRDWFTWPNSLFAEFIEQCLDEGII
ncbi:MAG: glycoside hydrolase family 125 protein [Clostridia bacterium]|nr:glycoside hydrolase family 125 protein [Clostridia bacterium]